MGYAEVDVNGPSQTGFTYSHATLRDGLRCSTAKAYLRTCNKRPNLHVSTYSFAERVLVGASSGAAYGVEFRHRGRSHTVYANCEVVLAAGAIQSPQLLLLSGIGPAEHLQEVGVPLVLDLPGVGENLQDHVALGGMSYVIDPPEGNSKCDREFSFILPNIMNMRSIKEFVSNNSGPLYLVPECEAMAFIDTPYDFYFSKFFKKSVTQVVFTGESELLQAERSSWRRLPGRPAVSGFRRGQRGWRHLCEARLRP